MGDPLVPFSIFQISLLFVVPSLATNYERIHHEETMSERPPPSTVINHLYGGIHTLSHKATDFHSLLARDACFQSPPNLIQ
jgi:hypothetical protein